MHLKCFVILDFLEPPLEITINIFVISNLYKKMSALGITV
jgi:hypothetical protein